MENQWFWFRVVCVVVAVCINWDINWACSGFCGYNFFLFPMIICIGIFSLFSIVFHAQLTKRYKWIYVFVSQLIDLMFQTQKKWKILPTYWQHTFSYFQLSLYAYNCRNHNSPHKKYPNIIQHTSLFVVKPLFYCVSLNLVFWWIFDGCEKLFGKIFSAIFFWWSITCMFQYTFYGSF